MSELEVYDCTAADLLETGTFNCSAAARCGTTRRAAPGYRVARMRLTIDVVEYPSSTGTSTTRPPAASTVSRPTI